jgi:hypothetical protein
MIHDIVYTRTMIRRPDRLPCAAGMAVLCLVGGPPPARAQVLDLPPRPAEAPGGAAIARDIRLLEFDAREERVYTEFAGGNIPSWLRILERVEMTRQSGGREYRVTFWVTPDYVAVGSDTDYFLVPLSPQTAQRIADRVGASLPTAAMVDAIWVAARVRLDPAPIPPSPEMTTVQAFEDHDRLVRAQRIRGSAPPGALVAGHKKDVVITAQLDSFPGKVAIYGWHRPDGEPIQPLYAGHTDRWVDYSHGIRLVSRVIRIDGNRRDMLDVLRDTALAGLLSDDGVMVRARYSLPGGDRPVASIRRGRGSGGWPCRAS